MKKGALITLLIGIFIIGAAYGASSGNQPLTQGPAVGAMSALEQHKEEFELALEEGREVIPYSQLVQSVPEEAAAPPAQDVPNLGHNAISYFGQSMGVFFRRVIREILRAIVIFFDRVLAF